MSETHGQKTLFHVTDPANVAAILRDGLRANDDGEIFTITDERLANSIARDQLFLRKYTLFAIDIAGISGKILPDPVAEFAAYWHRVIVQPLIAREFVRVVYSADTLSGLTEGDYMRYGIAGMSRGEVDQMYKEIAKINQDQRMGR